jgi:23S rRNA (uracil1939-C5)-methyltransferase
MATINHLPDAFELLIDGMAQGGDGVGRVDGVVVFAAGALPGERVQVRVVERKSNYVRGVVETVVSAAPERVVPRLEGADHIPWQHMAYQAQLRFKQAILQEQLAKLAGLAAVTVAPVIPAAHPWGYRNTAHLHGQDNGSQIGYYAANSHTVQDLAYDPLLLPVLNDALAGLRALLPSPRYALSGVTLRGSAYGYSVARLRGTGDMALLAEQWRKRVPSLAGCVVAAPPRKPPRRSAPPTDAPAEAEVLLHDEVGGMVFSLSPDSFFQAHTAQTDVLLRVVRDGLALPPGARLLDAYSGVGTFALPLAHALGEVVAIEEHTTAVADGERSARFNDVTNVRFVAGAVEAVLPDLAPPFAGAILDPPRRGCHAAALAALLALAPPRIAYVSCHPGILARDMRILLDGGYDVLSVQPVDMFPQTPHIECVAVLGRG